MKKIMILYASIGGGHYKAADALKNYIQEHYGNYNVEMIDALKYTNKVIDKIIINSYVNMARYSPKTWGDIYKFSEKQYSVANFSNMVQKLLSQKLFKLFKDEQPDIVISTHPFITEMVASLKKHKKTDTELCVVITDYASHKFWEIKHEYVNKYFVASEEMRFGLQKVGISPQKIFVTGIPVGPAFLKKYDKHEILNNIGLDENKRVVLLFGGGEYGLSNVKSFFNALMNLEEDIQIVAIAGKNKKHKKMFEKMSKGFDKSTIILGYTDKIAELMSISDLVISKPGGLTTTEILVSNVPFVIINPIPGQEEENANFLTNNGAAARLWDAGKSEAFLENILNDNFRIENMKIMQKYLSRPNSTKEIIEEILKEK